MKTFAEVLREQVAARANKRSRPVRRLRRLLDAKPSRRRDRILARMEAHARVELAERGLVVGEDWGAVKERDWKSFFDGLLKFLLALLAAFGPLLI